MVSPIYLDYNATTPHDPEVTAVMLPFLEEIYGNPSSSHWYGIEPKRAVENARRQVAGAIGCTPQEIVFTSGGTESNNYALKGAAFSRMARGRHIITSQVEHPAVLEVCRHLSAGGFDITRVPVDENGAVRPDTVLISIMHANNEVGTIQPIADIARLAREHGILMHTDAAQSLGKISVDVEELPVDLLSIAGHKIYAPKGVGALYLRQGTRLEPFLHGAGQEQGRRAGTENVLGIVGLGRACEIAARDLETVHKAMRQTRDHLLEQITDAGINVRLNGRRELSLPNTLSLSFFGVEANRILEEIGLDVAASAGAACHSDKVEISHVLRAMGVPQEWAKGTLRLSTGKFTTQEETDFAARVIVAAVKKLQGAD